jgi:quercetin dioxygenase-like cupin family protein
MPIVHAPGEPTHTLPGARFTALATPSTAGATDTAVWLVELLPGNLPTPHSLSREETFVVLDGRATVELAGERSTVGPGDAILVPADVPFCLDAAGASPVRLVCCFPVGGRARLADGTELVPPRSE